MPIPFLNRILMQSIRAGANPVTMGLLDTTFSVVQLAGGPIMGRLCDLKGARGTIILAQSAGVAEAFGISVRHIFSAPRRAESLTRRFMHLSPLSGALAYFLQGIAVNLPLLFASKIPSLLQHCMIGAQAGVTVLALPNIRALAMGRLSLRYGR
jgi:MFS family permease